MPPLIRERSCSYWRLSLYDPELDFGDVGAVADVRRLIERIEDVADVRVVVFDRVGPNFYLACSDREPASKQERRG